MMWKADDKWLSTVSRNYTAFYTPPPCPLLSHFLFHLYSKLESRHTACLIAFKPDRLLNGSTELRILRPLCSSPVGK